MPDDLLVLSSTAFNDAALCLKRYEYRHVLKFVPRPRDARPAMRRGTWIHRLLQLGDLGASRGEMEAELERMCEWAIDHEVPDSQVTPLAVQVWGIVLDYYDFWRDREAREGGPYTTVETEFPVAYEPDSRHRLTATVDRVVRDPKDRLWLWERKSTEDLPDSDWRCVDPQTMLQYFGARLGRENPMPVVGVIFDYVRTDPGPAVRVYKPSKQGRGGRIYDDVLGKSVTARRFEAATDEIRANWQADPGNGPDDSIQAQADCDQYIHEMRTRLVNPAGWYQRYVVLRPDDHMRETIRDVAMVAHSIRYAQEKGHYPRSFNILTCRLFCPYGKLCTREYQLGHPSAALRQELFEIETPDLRSEGRSDHGSR